MLIFRSLRFSRRRRPARDTFRFHIDLPKLTTIFFFEKNHKLLQESYGTSKTSSSACVGRLRDPYRSRLSKNIDISLEICVSADRKSVWLQSQRDSGYFVPQPPELRPFRTTFQEVLIRGTEGQLEIVTSKIQANPRKRLTSAPFWSASRIIIG